MLEQYFKNDEINIKSHIKGYVSDKDLDKTAIDNQCVTDCNNMDFYPDHDRRRNPFDVYLATLATLITDLELTDYKIHNICEKRFYDKDGNYADCLIAIVTYQGLAQAQPTKIFINQWYNPGSAYENGSGTASDFDAGWMEITEYYATSKYTFEAGSWVIGANTYTLRSSNATIYAKANEYFKGFFVTHSDNRVIGIVTKSLKNTTNYYDYETIIEYPRIGGHADWFGNSGTYTGSEEVTYKILCYTITAIGGGVYDVVFKWSTAALPDWATVPVWMTIRTDGAGVIPETSLLIEKGITGKINTGNQSEYVPFTTDPLVCDEAEFDTYISVASGYTYFELDQETAITLTSANKLTRFPVTHFNYDNWTNVTNVEINKDFPNVVRFYCENYRALWFGFIKDRKYLYNASSGYSVIDGFTNWADFTKTVTGYLKEGGDTDVYFRFDKWEDTGDFYIDVYYKYNETDDWIFYRRDIYALITDPVSYSILLNNGLTYNFSAAQYSKFDADDNIVRVTTTLSYSHTWDGFWFGYDSPEISGRKTYLNISDSVNNDAEVYIEEGAVGKELGIFYKIHDNGKDGTLTYYDRVYQTAIEFDNYQTFFVASILTNDKHQIKIYLYIKTWFDRRMTTHLLFYDETDNINPNTTLKKELPNSYLCGETYHEGEFTKGLYPLKEMIVAETTLNNDQVIIHNDNSSLDSGDNKIANIKTCAIGLSLNSYLNHYYWKALEVKAKGGTKVGDNILAYNLSEDSMELDKDSKGNVGGIGKTALTVSNIQNGGINTPSIMTTERIRELARDEILGVKCIYGTSFLLFTETETKWYELDDTNYVFTNVGNFQYGCVASKSIVEASTQDIAPVGTASHRFGARMFNGIYWASYDSIYAFFQNEPIDILEGKWKKEYQEILELTNFDPETDIIGAYNPYMNEVWFWFKLSDESGYTDRIYVYNIDYKHWKKYTYYQTSPTPTPTEFIKGFAQSNEGMLYWWMDDNIIYTQEPEGTGNKQDYTSGTPQDITFFYEQYINHGNTNIIKTLDRIDLIYDITPYETGGKYSRVDAYIEVKANAAETSILSSSDLITLQTNVTAAIAGKLYKKRIPIKLRIPNNYIKLKFSSDTTTDTYIEQLKLLQLTINSKISRGTLTKN